jgi:hypothetical protein
MPEEKIYLLLEKKKFILNFLNIKSILGIKFFKKSRISL